MAASRSAKPHSSPSSPGSCSSSPRCFRSRHSERYWVPGDLAQPHPQLAVPPELVDGGQCPEEGLLGHFLRRVGVRLRPGCSGTRRRNTSDRSPQNPARPPLLSAIGRMGSSFVTKKVPGFRALFYGSFLRHSSTGNLAPQMWQYMILLPFRLHLDDRKSCPDNSAPQEGHTNTVAYRRLHRTSPTAPATTAATPRGHRSVPAAIIPPNRSTHQITKPAHFFHRPSTISLFFLWRHYIMEASDLQGGR